MAPCRDGAAVTIREQILVALVLRLGALTVEVPGLEIRRNPRHAITKAPKETIFVS